MEKTFPPKKPTKKSNIYIYIYIYIYIFRETNTLRSCMGHTKIGKQQVIRYNLIKLNQFSLTRLNVIEINIKMTGNHIQLHIYYKNNPRLS